MVYLNLGALPGRTVIIMSSAGGILSIARAVQCLQQGTPTAIKKHTEAEDVYMTLPLRKGWQHQIPEHRMKINQVIFSIPLRLVII